MREKNRFLFCLLVLSILLSGCDRDYYFKETDSTDLSREEFAGLKLHQNINDEAFVTKFGNQIEVERDHELYQYYLLSNGIIIATTDQGEIVRMMGELPQTEKGITFGHSKKQILDSYGENYYTRVEQGVDIVGYVDWELRATLEFWLDEKQKIIIIRFDDVSVQ
jgi:hypothetical protein